MPTCSGSQSWSTSPLVLTSSTIIRKPGHYPPSTTGLPTPKLHPRRRLTRPGRGGLTIYDIRIMMCDQPRKLDPARLWRMSVMLCASCLCDVSVGVSVDIFRDTCTHMMMKQAYEKAAAACRAYLYVNQSVCSPLGKETACNCPSPQPQLCNAPTQVASPVVEMQESAYLTYQAAWKQYVFGMLPACAGHACACDWHAWVHDDVVVLRRALLLRTPPATHACTQVTRTLQRMLRCWLGCQVDKQMVIQ